MLKYFCDFKLTFKENMLNINRLEIKIYPTLCNAPYDNTILTIRGLVYILT